MTKPLMMYETSASHMAICACFASQHDEVVGEMLEKQCILEHAWAAACSRDHIIVPIAACTFVPCDNYMVFCKGQQAKNFFEGLSVLRQRHEDMFLLMLREAEGSTTCGCQCRQTYNIFTWMIEPHCLSLSSQPQVQTGRPCTND